MRNSEEDRKLEDPRGWNDAGYVPTNHRLNNKANNIGSYYMKFKSNMGGKSAKESRRFSSITMGIGGLAVGQLTQAIGTAILSTRVSDLDTTLKR